MAARRILIVDLSNNNARVNLARVKQAGIVGVWHKASEGESFTDKFAHARRQEAARVGLRFGFYHFARPGHGDARREAEHFCRIAGKIGRRDLCPVLDYEVNDAGLAAWELTAWARGFNHVVKDTLGVWPLFYSFPSFIEDMRAEKSLGRGLWLASFGKNDGREHPFSVPRPFKKALAHQFTSNARIPGVDGHVDLSSAPRLVPLLARGWRGV